MNEIKIKRTYNISDKTIGDWIDNTFCGGSHYWLSDYNFEPEPSAFLTKGKSINSFACNLVKGKGYKVSGEYVKNRLFDKISILFALEEMSHTHTEAFDRLIDESYDCCDTDVLLQMALFNEVIYG